MAFPVRLVPDEVSGGAMLEIWRRTGQNGADGEMMQSSPPHADQPAMRVLLVSLQDWRIAERNQLSASLAEQLSCLRERQVPSMVLSEDYWQARGAIVRSRLSAMLGVSARIPARLTRVRRIDNAATDQFLEANHLNGITSSKFRYGLFLPQRYYRVLPSDFDFNREAGEMLVAVATFSNARIFRQDNAPFRSHELIRFASLLGTNVVGALDKLLRAFILQKSPDDIMTYADLEWSDGRSYRKLGFVETGRLGPQHAVLDPVTGRRAYNAQQTDRSPTEHLTVFNMGSIKFVKTIRASDEG